MSARIKYAALLLLGIVTVSAWAAAEDSAQGYGTLKIGSAPIECSLIFRGENIRKDRAVLIYEKVPAGQYTIEYRLGDKTLTKAITVNPGKVTFVFGNLSAPARTTAPINLSSKADVPEEKSPYRVKIRSLENEDKAPATIPSRVGKSYEDADLFFEIAEILRKAVNPFSKLERYRRCEQIYNRILERWPDSDKVEQCHYQLANLYESIFYRQYEKAIEKYKNVLEYNFKTELCVRNKIAVLYENRLKDFGKAKEWYALAAKHSPSESVRDKAAKKVEYLESKNY